MGSLSVVDHDNLNVSAAEGDRERYEASKDKVRRLVAELARDADDEQILLDALGLIEGSG